MKLFHFLLIAGALWFGVLPQSYADCAKNGSATASFGSLSSFTVASMPQNIPTSSGFTCTSSSIITLLTTNTISATINTGHPSGSTPPVNQ